MLTIPLDPSSSTPMYEQIYNYIKKDIIAGTLKSGEKLPSTRSLASYLLVSRNTIDMAYGQLVSEGYVDSKQKRGYYVNEIIGLSALHLQGNSDDITNTEKEEVSYHYDFSPFSVDTSHFPFSTWKQLTANCLSLNENFFQVPQSQGELEFRTAIATYLHQSRGVNASADQIIVGAGADYLLQLLSNLLCSTDIIAMEDPGYLQANKIFLSQQRNTIPIPLDEHGIKIDLLTDTDANIVYVTPSHQYPLGTIMPITRRLSLLSWAKEQPDRYIIEDDHDSEFRYVGKPIPSLQSIDTNEKVIYMGTFSKSVSPALRIAYMVLPPSLLSRYHNSLSFLSSTVSRIDQHIMTSFISDGYFERHLNRMRKHYKSKHDQMLCALRCFAKTVTVQGCNAGLHLVVTFHTSLSEDALVQKAADSGIRLYPLSSHYAHLPEDYEPTFMFGYANLSEDEIVSGIQLLYQSFSPLPS